jgi:hypothetical protein
VLESLTVTYLFLSHAGFLHVDGWRSATTSAVDVGKGHSDCHRSCAARGLLSYPTHPTTVQALAEHYRRAEDQRRWSG